MKARFEVTASYTKDKWWAIECPDLPGVHAQCKLEKHIGDEAKKAITEYLEAAAATEEPLEIQSFDPVLRRNIYYVLVNLPQGIQIKIT